MSPSEIIKEFPLVCRWFIGLAKRKQFTDAVWRASNDVGYGAYRDFVLRRGRGPVLKAVSSPFRLGQKSSPQPEAGGTGPGVSAKVNSKTEPKAAQNVSLKLKN